MASRLLAPEARVSGFTFDAHAHRYYLDGIEIPGVTCILKTVGLSPVYGNGFFNEATFRGTHVHECCELLDLPDGLDWPSVYPKYKGWVDGYVKFKQDTGAVPLEVERQLLHHAFRFAGTLDRRYRFPDGSTAQLDIKSGVETEWHCWQTAGYYLLGLSTDPSWKADRRGCLYLKENGTYQLVWHDDPGDLRIFSSALTITHTRRRLDDDRDSDP